MQIYNKEFKRESTWIKNWTLEYHPWIGVNLSLLKEPKLFMWESTARPTSRPVLANDLFSSLEKIVWSLAPFGQGLTRMVRGGPTTVYTYKQQSLDQTKP